MRSLLIALSAVSLTALSLTACTQGEQDKAQAEVNDTAGDVKDGAVNLGNDLEASVKDAGDELKSITDDPEVKAAAAEAKDSLKEMGAAIKDAAKKDEAKN